VGQTFSLDNKPWMSKAWLFKTDCSGNVLWNRTYDGMGYGTVAHTVIQTGDDGYALAVTHLSPVVTTMIFGLQRQVFQVTCCGIEAMMEEHLTKRTVWSKQVMVTMC